MFSIRLAAAAAVLATVVTSVSASSSINETALCRLPESEDLATLLEGAAGVSPVNSIIFTHWKQFSKVFLLSQLEFAPPTEHSILFTLRSRPILRRKKMHVCWLSCQSFFSLSFHQLVVLTTTSRGFPVKVTRMSAADNEPVMWVDDLVKAVRQKDVEVNKQALPTRDFSYLFTALKRKPGRNF